MYDARLADDAAERIAENFWRRFQMSRWPNLPMPGGAEPDLVRSDSQACADQARYSSPDA